MTRSPEIDVAIVGSGPVGLVLAALLDRHGVTSRVFERRTSLHRDPQAHVINTRTMEILRELGLEAEVQRQAAPPMLLRWITWCESLAGRELGRIALQGKDQAGLARRLALSPTSIANLAQNRLEPLLFDLVRRSARSEVCFDSDVVAVEERDGEVLLDVRRNGGEGERVRASWVVACDGAGSRTRRGLGLELVGPASLQKFVSIYFEARLDRWTGGRSGPLFWIAGGTTRGVIIGFDLVHTWALMVPYSEPHTAEDFPLAVAERLVAGAIGDASTPFRITSIGNWNMSAQVADGYRRGRVFLAGDAAHRFPPSGGLGMNTGIQDAHNLAWKLAAVLRGEAGEELLQTYEAERRPVAQQNCDQSVRNAMRMMEVDMVLGVSTLAPVDPGLVLKGDAGPIDFGLDGDDTAAVAKRAALDEVIQSQAEHFDFGGLDLGFRYDEGAVVADGSEPPPFDVRVYVPSACPGSRLPHVWVTERGRRISTLDLAGPGRFTLFTDDDGGAWTAAARRIVRRNRLDLGLAVIGKGEGEGYRDVSGAWAQVSGLRGGGALLVRPDGHVAWRQADRPSSEDQARRTLSQALATLLSRTGHAGLEEDAA